MFRFNPLYQQFSFKILIDHNYVILEGLSKEDREKQDYIKDNSRLLYDIKMDLVKKSIEDDVKGIEKAMEFIEYSYCDWSKVGFVNYSLECACRHGNTKTVNFLFERINKRGYPVKNLMSTCIEKACKNGHLGVIKEVINLQKKFDICSKGIITDKALYYAKENERLDVLVFFFNLNKK
jgi:hypothetical protein